jgi:hypothetical protein
MLFYPGFEVLPPLVFYRTEKTDEQRFAQQCRELGSGWIRWQTAPIPFRRQNHGDYLIPSLTLRPELAPGESGLALHQTTKVMPFRWSLRSADITGIHMTNCEPPRNNGITARHRPAY